MPRRLHRKQSFGLPIPQAPTAIVLITEGLDRKKNPTGEGKSVIVVTDYIDLSTLTKEDYWQVRYILV